MTIRKKQMLRAMLTMDGIIAIAFGTWIWIHFFHRPAGKPDIQLLVRRVEPTLTEIDVFNRGQGPGPIGAVDVSWPEADLVDEQALPGFDVAETGRRSARFHSKDSAARLAPGDRREVGWVRLTEVSPVHAEFADTGETH